MFEFDFDLFSKKKTLGFKLNTNELTDFFRLLGKVIWGGIKEKYLPGGYENTDFNTYNPSDPNLANE